MRSPSTFPIGNLPSSARSVPPTCAGITFTPTPWPSSHWAGPATSCFAVIPATGSQSSAGRLKTLDRSRNNAKLWEGRAMNAGRLSKRGVNVVLTGNLIKRHLGLKLTAEEQALENDFLGVKNGQPV